MCMGMGVYMYGCVRGWVHVVKCCLYAQVYVPGCLTLAGVMQSHVFLCCDVGGDQRSSQVWGGQV